MSEQKPKLFTNRNKILSTIALMVVLLLIYFNFSFITAIYNSIIISIQKPFNGIVQNTINLQSTFTQYEEIIEDNNQLKEENVALLQENNQLLSLKEENRQLKDLLNYSENNSNYKYITAGVYAQDSINLSDAIAIDRGSDNGVKINDHVIFSGIYIGQVISVTNNSSQVRLITSPGLSVVGQISSINTNGIVQGQIGFGLIMKDIPPDASLEVGQVVTTAPIDSHMPADQLLGEIIEIKHNDQDIFQEAILQPYFNLKEIKYVLVKIDE